MKRWLATLSLLLMPALAAATPLDDDVRWLSAYPAGGLPDTDEVRAAIERLGIDGDKAEVGLLRSVAEAEAPALRHAALEAIASIRSRSVEAQREAFARTLPDWPELASAPVSPVRRELGREEQACLAYADLLLESDPVVDPSPRAGDPAAYLLIGQPHRALMAAKADPTVEGRRMEAKAREEVGDVPGALQQYAELASQGDSAAFAALDRYGVDAERLLLGMLASPQTAQASAVAILDVLVAEGATLTVDVLAEQTRSPDTLVRLTAADALARMLEGSVRLEPLRDASRLKARQALVHVVHTGPAPVAALARDALE